MLDMAITKLASPIAGLRGTIGGLVYSANGAGTYVKPWARPSNPQTTTQMIQRGNLGSMGASWRALTAAQRATWDLFAAQPAQALTNSLGDVYYISGYGWYVKCNTRLLRVGRSILTSAPLSPRPPAHSLTTINVTPAGSESDLATGGVASASSTNPGFPASNAFDDNLTTYWQSQIGSPVSWLHYVLPTTAILRRYDIYFPTTTLPQAPATWYLAGWIGGAWVTLHSVTSFAPTIPGWQSFYFQGNSTATQYAIFINGNFDPLATSTIMYEVAYYAGALGSSAVIYPQDSVHVPPRDLILHVAMTDSTARAVQYPSYAEILAIQDPGLWYAFCQDELTTAFGTILTGRRWFARLYNQTDEGLRSPINTTAADTID